MTAETVKTWSILQGDYNRPADADYDREISERRRKKRATIVLSATAFLVSSLLVMSVLLYLTAQM